MIEALFIDLDDTFFMTEEPSFELENSALGQLGRSPMSREAHLANWGKPLFEAITERSPGVDVEQFRQAYKPLIKVAIEEGLLDKVSEQNLVALERVKDLGKSIVVLTSRSHTEVEHLLEPEHALADYVEAFYYKDIMQFHKPDPRAFAHIESEHGWQPYQCVYVGDSIGDAKAANGAGLHFVASLESGLHKMTDFSAHNVVAFISTFPEIVDVIPRLDNAV